MCTYSFTGCVLRSGCDVNACEWMEREGVCAICECGGDTRGGPCE